MRVRDYLERCHQQTIPAMKSAGGQELVLLSGLIDQELWERGRTLGRQRGRLSVRDSWVRLWRAHDF